MSVAAAPRLPLAPLIRAAGLGGEPDALSTLAERTGHTRSAFQGWAHRGIPIYTADTIAVSLGMHPCEAWPEWPTITVAPLRRPHHTTRTTADGTRHRRDHDTVSAAFHYADHWADIWRRCGLTVEWHQHGRITATDSAGTIAATLTIRLGPNDGR